MKNGEEEGGTEDSRAIVVLLKENVF